MGQGRSDVLIMQINDFYTPNSNPLFSGHQITVTDYYKNSQGLHLDTNVDKDISTFGYSNQRKYTLDIIRYQGDNSA